jgi:hypothetical protein
MLAPESKVTHHRHQLRCAAHAAESYQLEGQENEFEDLEEVFE